MSVCHKETNLEPKESAKKEKRLIDKFASFDLLSSQRFISLDGVSGKDRSVYVEYFEMIPISCPSEMNAALRNQADSKLHCIQNYPGPYG